VRLGLNGIELVEREGQEMGDGRIGKVSLVLLVAEAEGERLRERKKG